MRDGMAIIAAGMAFTLVGGGQAIECSSSTTSVTLTASGGLQNLTDAMDCTGPGVYNVTLHGRLQIEQAIEIVDQKHVHVTGVYDDSQEIAGDGYRYPVIDAGSSTGIFFVSNRSRLNIRFLTLAGGHSDDGGAVRVTSSSLLYVSDCDFTNNRASTTGGENDLGPKIDIIVGVHFDVSSMF